MIKLFRRTFGLSPCWLLVGLLWLAGSVARAADVAFFYALDQDVAALKQAADGTQAVSLKAGGHVITRMVLGGRRVFACKMESGAVATALSAEALLVKYPCDLVIVIGPAGALSDDLKVGQWFRVGKVIAYQKGLAASSGFALSPQGEWTLAEPDAGAKLPALWAEAPVWTVASGEVFVAAADFRGRIQEQTRGTGAPGAAAVEMNLFGVAMACAESKVPLLCWRVISDHANEQAGADFQRFVASYDGAGGKAVAEYLRALPPDPNSPASYPRLQKLLQP